MYPHERSLVKRMANQPFALIGVNSDPKEKVLAALERENITWRSFFNGGSTGGPISRAWGVHGWPTIYVLDQNGVIRFKNVRGEAMDEAVDELLKEALSALAKDVKSTDPDVRGIAAFRMARYNVDGALAAIKPLAQDGDRSVQTRAAIGLTLLGQPAKPLLPLIRNAVSDSDMEVRIAALETLGKLKDKATADLAKTALQDVHVEVRRVAVTALGQIGDPVAIPALTQAVDDVDVVTARNAVYALAELDTAASTNVLKKLAADADHSARVWVAVALHRIGQPGTGERFAKLIAADDPKIRRQVVGVLPELSGFDALDLMIGALEDADAQVGKKAREFLASNDSPRAKKALTEFLTARIEKLLPDLAGRDYRKQSAARSQLAGLGAEAAPMLLAKLDDGSVPPTAAYALASVIGASGNTQVIAPVAKKLADAGLDMRLRTSYEAILRGMGSKARDATKTLIGSDQSVVRLSGVRTLLSARDKEATAILKDALKDAELQVRGYAAYALAMRRDSDALPVLKEVFAKGDPAQLQLATYGIAYYGEETALPLLTKAAASESLSTRMSAISGMGRFRSKEATAAIVEAAGNDTKLQSAMMSALYRQNTSAAAEALGKFLDSDQPNVRKLALQWLQRMRVVKARQLVAEYQKKQAAESAPKQPDK